MRWTLTRVDKPRAAVDGGRPDLQRPGHLRQFLTFFLQTLPFRLLQHDPLRRVFPALGLSSSRPDRALEKPSDHLDLWAGAGHPGLARFSQ